ncbi:MAG: hypothetical protein IOD12_13795, partial [Silvanigrellales bacterium]|nr:hypothetical protein [Silvanigrellales bacterium]
TGLTSDCSTAVSIAPGAPTQLAFLQNPSSSGTSGVALGVQPQVVVRDANGNAVASASDSVSLGAYTDAACTASAPGILAAASNPVTAVSGVAGFSGVSYAGAPATVYLLASSPSRTSVCSPAIAISAGSASKLAFFAQPSSSAIAGSAFAVQPRVEILDASNTRVTAASNTIALTAFSDPGCSVPSSGTWLGGASSVSASSGLATFSGLGFSKAGALYLKATSGAFASVCSDVVTVDAGSASKVTFSSQPGSNAQASVTFGSQPVVEIQDAQGNKVSTATNSVTLEAYSNPTCTTTFAGTLTPASAQAASAGQVAYTNVSFSKSGSLYLKATSGALTPVCSNLVNVASGAATKLSFSQQPSSSATSGTSFLAQPVVVVQDSANNTVSSAAESISLEIHSNAGCTAPASASTFTANSNPVVSTGGVAAFGGVGYGAVGTFYLKASSGSLTSDCSNAIAVAAGSATKLAFTTQPSNSVTAGVNFATSPVVQTQDASGALATSSASIQLSAYSDSGCSTPATGNLTATTNPLAATSGIASFSGVKFNKAGNIYLKATASGYTSMCSNGVTVNPGSADKVAFATQPANIASASVAFPTQPIVEIRDAQENLLSSASSNVTIAAFTNATCTVAATGTLSGTLTRAASSGVATFTDLSYGKTETIYLKATGAGIANPQCSSAVVVSAGVPTKLAFGNAGSLPSSAFAGTPPSVQPQVEVRDADDNPVASGAARAITLAAFTDAACTTAVATPADLAVGSNPTNTVAGVANFTGVSYSKIGTVYLGATASGLTKACFGPLAVGAGAGTRLAFAQQPSSTATAASNFTTQPQVEVVDAQGCFAALGNPKLLLA